MGVVDLDGIVVDGATQPDDVLPSGPLNDGPLAESLHRPRVAKGRKVK